MKVAIMESLGVSAETLARLKKPFEEEGVVFEEFKKTGDVPTLIDEAKDADVMILANMPMSAEVLRACPKLRFVNIAFTGVDHVGLEAARERGMAVSNASGYSNEAVSELVLAMVLSIARRLGAVEKRCREGGTKDGLVGWEIKNKTVGIVGLGKIGTRTAELFHAFGAKILACSRSVHPDAPSYVTQLSLDELLAQSDIVTLHAFASPENHHLISAEKLALMKEGAYIVNTARGDLIDTWALIDALKAGKLGGAVLDVIEDESGYYYTDQRGKAVPAHIAELEKLPEVTLLQHMAFCTYLSANEQLKTAIEAAYLALNGLPNPYEIK
jgi:D-3-phosphoglycerate dehydrogenase